MERLDDLHDYFLEMATLKIHDGMTYRLTFPFWPVSMKAQVWHTANPENVEHILKTHFENYPKGPVFFENMYDLLGEGIFNVDGSKWSTQRKTASHEFSVNRFRDYMSEVMSRHA